MVRSAVSRNVAGNLPCRCSNVRIRSVARPEGLPVRRTLAFGTTIAAIFAGLSIFVTGSASADPSASAWASLRQCESSGNYSINTGNGYFGAYQFDQATWQSVGGSGSPNQASSTEQDYRALYLYRMRGWSPWVCASLAGLREDSSANSGVVPTRADSAYIGTGGTGTYTPVPADSCRIGKATGPAWGGTTFVRGRTYRALACWQKQLSSKGYQFTGTGYFGSNTAAAAHDLQGKYGLKSSNVIDAATWAAAWGRPAAPKPAPSPKPTPRPTANTWPGLTASACHVGSRKAPAWPQVSFEMGSYDRNLACWQMQMGRRGYGLQGVGYYGAHTLEASKDIQNRNKLGGTGLIGPKTWKAAWEGKARA